LEKLPLTTWLAGVGKCVESVASLYLSPFFSQSHWQL
jgi:hypothetical protein